MSDNIPFEIQLEIIKKVSDVKSLIQFRSVSKPWKSFIDGSDFIKGYGARHTQPPSFILSYKPVVRSELQHICLVDDDIETFKVQKQELAPFVTSLLFKDLDYSIVVGACHGLLCVHGRRLKDYKNWMLVIWNPSIGKSFGIVVPSFHSQSKIYSRKHHPDIKRSLHRLVFGFGVCPVTKDPIVVKIIYASNWPWYVEVFTLSSGIWNVIPCNKLPRDSIKLNETAQVVIDRFIYWSACETTFDDHGEFTTSHIVVSFDLIGKEFKVVDLPHSLTNGLHRHADVSVCKLSESLIVFAYVNETRRYDVWVMEHDSSFRKLFTIGARIETILGFSKSGGAIVETRGQGKLITLDVYDSSSQRSKNLGISGLEYSFFMDFYKESLLLLDHSDLHIYS